MSNERPALNLDDDEIDIIKLLSKKKSKKIKVDELMVREVSERSGFPSREAKKIVRRRKKSPFTGQLGLKCRPEIRELFYSLGSYLDLYDHTVFEHALLALIEKEGTSEQLKTYQNIVD